MCRLKFRFLAALLTFGIGVLIIGFWKGLPVPVNQNKAADVQPAADQIPQARIEKPADEDFNHIRQKTILNCTKDQPPISFQGVSFVCDPQIGAQIEITEFSEFPLQDKNDKPDYVHPSYLSFKFQNGDKAQPSRTDYFSQIDVYPLAEYRRMYSLAGSQGFDESVDSLKKTLAGKKSDQNQNGALLTATDGSFGFKSYLKYFPFKNGTGRGFVTQITIEVTIINNEELVYAFEGITDDGKYYVQALFPVRASFLPDKATDEFEGYSINNYSKLTKKYNQYISLIRNRLDSLPSDQYQPDLNKLVRLISSVEAK